MCFFKEVSFEVVFPDFLWTLVDNWLVATQRFLMFIPIWENVTKIWRAYFFKSTGHSINSGGFKYFYFHPGSLGFHDPVWLTHIFSSWVESWFNNQLVMLSIVVFFSLIGLPWKLMMSWACGYRKSHVRPQTCLYKVSDGGSWCQCKQLVAPWKQILPVTPWSKYMAQSPKGRFILGLYPHGNCAIYFYPGVIEIQLLTYHRRAVWQANIIRKILVPP